MPIIKADDGCPIHVEVEGDEGRLRQFLARLDRERPPREPDQGGGRPLRAHAAAVPPRGPGVQVPALDDEDVGIRTLQEGAQDYVAKGWMNGPTLVRSIRYADERNRIEAELIRARSMKSRVSGKVSLVSSSKPNTNDAHTAMP